jgi:hypothetical protein
LSDLGCAAAWVKKSWLLTREIQKVLPDREKYGLPG